MATHFVPLTLGQQMANSFANHYAPSPNTLENFLQRNGHGRAPSINSSFIQQYFPNGALSYPIYNPFANLSVTNLAAIPGFLQPFAHSAKHNSASLQKSSKEKVLKTKRTTMGRKKATGSPLLDEEASLSHSPSEPRSILTSPLVGEDLVRSPLQLSTAPLFTEPSKLGHTRRRSRRIAEAALAKSYSASLGGRKGGLSFGQDGYTLGDILEDGSAGLGVLEWDGIVHKVDADLGLGGDLLYDYNSPDMLPLSSPSTTIKSGLTYSPPTSAPPSPYMKDWTDETSGHSLDSISPDIMAMLTPELIGFLSPDFTGVPFEGGKNVYSSRKGALGVSQYIDPCQLAAEMESTGNSASFFDDLLAELSASQSPSDERSVFSPPTSPSPQYDASAQGPGISAESIACSHKRKRSLGADDSTDSNKRIRKIKSPSRCQHTPHPVPKREPSVESISDHQRSHTPLGSESQLGQPKQDISGFYTAVPMDRSCTGGGKPLRRYECLFDGCHRIFPRRTAVTAHIMTHLEDKPFVCPDPKCGAAFVRQHDLRRHERIHNSVKSFTCPCGKGFSRGDALMRHRCRGICQGSIAHTRYSTQVQQQHSQQQQNPMYVFG